MNPRKAEYNRRYMRALRAHRKALGVCLVCGEPVEKFVKCLEHRQESNEGVQLKRRLSRGERVGR